MRISHISWRKSHVYPELIKGFLRLSRTYQRVPLLIPNSSKDSFAYPELIKGFLCLSRTYQMVPLLIPSLSKGSFAYPKFIKGKAAKVSKGRPQSPLVASAEAKPSVAYKEMIIAILIPNSSRENLRPLRMEGAKNAVDFQDDLIPSAVRRPASWRRNTPGQR